MIRLNDKIKKGKLGVNYVMNIVDKCDCYFNKIEQENDIGIDATIEFTENKRHTGKCIAVQIKTGESYVNKKKSECIIPIGNHYEYWSNYCLPVYGIVYLLEENLAYWIDIKNYLNINKNEIESGKLNIIKFKMKSTNKFDLDNFTKYFKCNVKNVLPDISYNESITLINSENLDEIYIGINSLVNKYAYKKETWDNLINIFRTSNDDVLIKEVVYYLAHVPWHSDLWKNLNFSKESKENAKNIINNLSIDDIMKLLYTIDENGIERGTIGQCVEAIISSIDNNDKILKEIIINKELEEEVFNSAVTIFAYNNPTEFILVNRNNEIKKNWYVNLILESIQDSTDFDLY